MASNEREQQYIEKAAKILLRKRQGFLTKDQYINEVFALAVDYRDVMNKPNPTENAARLVRAVNKRAQELDKE